MKLFIFEVTPLKDTHQNPYLSGRLNPSDTFQIQEEAKDINEAFNEARKSYPESQFRVTYVTSACLNCG